jgi:phosphoserine phosphatase
MKRLNLIDLDKTLIPFDSFRLLIKEQVYQGDLYTCFLLVLRTTRLISSGRFKRFFILHLKKQPVFEKRMEAFATEIVGSVRSEILEMIEKHSGPETVNIIFSASPQEYVEKIAQRLGFTGFGSTFENNTYIELKGNQKIIRLQTLFPDNKFHYQFAISDSRDDRNLINLFENHILIGE